MENISRKIINTVGKESFSSTYTLFHSKTLYQALKMPRKGLLVYLTLSKLILRFDSSRKSKRITVSEILEEMPQKISRATLNKELKILAEEGLIRRFLTKRPEDGQSVYTYQLINRHDGQVGNSTSIPNYILEEVASKTTNITNFKVFLWFYLRQFKLKDFSSSTYYQIGNAIRIKRADFRDTKKEVKKSLKELSEKGLISFILSQATGRSKAQIQVTIESNSLISPHLMSNPHPLNRNIKKRLLGQEKSESKQGLRHEKESKDDSRVSSKIHPTIIINQINKNHINKPDFDFKKFRELDLRGLDKLKNPFTYNSYKLLLKRTNLSHNDIQFSIKNLMNFINHKDYDQSIFNPVAFLIRHLTSYGIYCYPEWFESALKKDLKNKHAKEARDSKKSLEALGLNFKLTAKEKAPEPSKKIIHFKKQDKRIKENPYEKILQEKFQLISLNLEKRDKTESLRI